MISDTTLTVNGDDDKGEASKTCLWNGLFTVRLVEFSGVNILPDAGDDRGHHDEKKRLPLFVADWAP